jgi:hypothetical protein
MTQKTVIIWDQCGETNIVFFVLDGDYRKLDNIYINCEYGEDSDSELAAEVLSGLLEEKLTKANELKEFPTTAVLEGAFVIVAGFLP